MACYKAPLPSPPAAHPSPTTHQKNNNNATQKAARHLFSIKSDLLKMKMDKQDISGGIRAELATAKHQPSDPRTDILQWLHTRQERQRKRLIRFFFPPNSFCWAKAMCKSWKFAWFSTDRLYWNPSGNPLPKKANQLGQRVAECSLT